MPLLDVKEVTVRFGGITALDGLSFTIDDGEICGLIGPNGAGKTTMFNVVSRIYEPTEGRVYFGEHELTKVPPHKIAPIGIARTFQNLALFPTMTVLENVMVGAHTTGKARAFTAMLRIGTGAEEKRLQRAAMDVIESLDLTQVAFRPPVGLPYGTMKRIELARALVSRPKLLMLDEPATGLTHSEVGELAESIKRVRREFGLTVLLVEHHMAMVMGISDKLVVLDFGRKIAEGDPKSVSSDPRVIEAYLGSPV